MASNIQVAVFIADGLDAGARTGVGTPIGFGYAPQSGFIAGTRQGDTGNSNTNHFWAEHYRVDTGAFAGIRVGIGGSTGFPRFNNGTREQYLIYRGVASPPPGTTVGTVDISVVAGNVFQFVERGTFVVRGLGFFEGVRTNVNYYQLRSTDIRSASGTYGSATLNLGITGLDAFSTQFSANANSEEAIRTLRELVFAELSNPNILAVGEPQRVTGGHQFTIETSATEAITPSFAITLGTGGVTAEHFAAIAQSRGGITDAAYYPLHDHVNMVLGDDTFNPDDYSIEGFTHRGVMLSDSDTNVTFDVALESQVDKFITHEASTVSVSNRAFATIARTNELLVIGRQPNLNVEFSLSDSMGIIPSTEFTVTSSTPEWRIVYSVNNPATFARMVTSAQAGELNYVVTNDPGTATEFDRQIPITANIGGLEPALAELSANDDGVQNSVLTVTLNRPYVSATDTITALTLTGPKAPTVTIPTLANGDTIFTLTFNAGDIVNEDLELNMSTTTATDTTARDYTINVQNFIEPNDLVPLSATLDLENLQLTMIFEADLPRSIHRSVFDSMLTNNFFNRFTLDNSGPGAQLFGIFNGVGPTEESADAITTTNDFITTNNNQLVWTVTQRTLDNLRHWARFTTIQDPEGFQLVLRRPVPASPCGGSGVQARRIPLTFENAAYCLEPCLPPASSPSALSGVKVTKLFPPNFSDQDYLSDRIEEQFGVRPTFQLGAYVFATPIEGFNFSLLGYPNLLYFSDGGDLVPPLSTVDPVTVDNLMWSEFSLGLTSGISREAGRGLSETTIDNRDFRWVLNGSLVVLDDTSNDSTLGTVLNAYGTNRPISITIPSEVLEIGASAQGPLVDGVADRGQDLVTVDSTTNLTPDSWITFTDTSRTTRHTGETKVYTISEIVSDTQIRVWPDLIADVADNSQTVVGGNTRLVMQITPGSLSIETIPNNNTYKIINMSLQEVL